MKRLGLTLVAAAGMFLFSQNAQAQVEEETREMEQMEAQKDTLQQNEFKRVDILALPQAVKDAVMTDMNGAVTDEAWVKEEEGKMIYKLNLSVEGGKKEAYIDEEGNWIEEEE